MENALRKIRLFVKLFIRKLYFIRNIPFLRGVIIMLSFCEECGRAVHDFSAPDETWAKVEPLIKHGSVLCYDCFCEKCSRIGLPAVWHLVPLTDSLAMAIRFKRGESIPELADCFRLSELEVLSALRSEGTYDYPESGDESMTGKEAYARQIAEVKAHMGELRSDGKSVERLLAARAAEPTHSQAKDAAGVLESEWVANNYPRLLAKYMGQWIAVKGEAVVAAASDVVRLKVLLDTARVHNPYIRRIEVDTSETNIFRFNGP